MKQTLPTRKPARGLLPKEGGVIGVWAASLAYGIILVLRAAPEPGPLGLALAGSILSLLAAGRTWTGRPREKAVAMLIAGVPMTAGAMIVRPWDTFLLLAGLAPLALVTIAGRGLQTILAGGPLLAGHGGFLALASGYGIVEALLPVAYSLMTVAIASSRVTGDWVGYTIPVALGSLAAALAGLGLCQYCGVSGGIILADVLARLIPYPFGVYSRMSLRLYGFHEAFRSLAIMIIAAACL